MNIGNITNQFSPPKPQCPLASQSRPPAARLGLDVPVPLLDIRHPCLFAPIIKVLAPRFSPQPQEIRFLPTHSVRHHLDSFEPVPLLLIPLLLILSKLLPIAQKEMLSLFPVVPYPLLD